jgi:hypothetical protein
MAALDLLTELLLPQMNLVGLAYRAERHPGAPDCPPRSVIRVTDSEIRSP